MERRGFLKGLAGALAVIAIPFKTFAKDVKAEGLTKAVTDVAVAAPKAVTVAVKKALGIHREESLDILKTMLKLHPFETWEKQRKMLETSESERNRVANARLAFLEQKNVYTGETKVQMAKRMNLEAMEWRDKKTSINV